MIIHAKGGTDCGNIVLFWPDNLPDDADIKQRKGDIEAFDQLQEEGKMIWFLAEGDGGFNVSIFIDEAVPDYLREFCGDEDHYPILLANGDAFFGGMEFLTKTNLDNLQQHPYMCEKVEIPEGKYKAWVYRTNVSSTFEKT